MLKDNEIEKMNHIKGLSRLVKDIYATDIREIQCDKARNQIVRSVYASLSEEQSRLQYRYLWHHFRFCPDCWQEYQMLRDLVEMEKRGEVQRPTYIPPRPDQPPWWGPLIDVAIFPGFPFGTFQFAMARNREAEPVRRQRREFEPVDVSLAEERIQIEFDLVAKADDSPLYDLSCTIKVTDETLKDNLDGALAWLQLGDEGPAIQEKALNDFGYVTFTDVQAGQYTLRLQLAGQTYAVTGIVLPQSEGAIAQNLPSQAVEGAASSQCRSRGSS